jgi:CHAT domain-containing protein/uncharacterized protein HemY
MRIRSIVVLLSVMSAVTAPDIALRLQLQAQESGSTASNSAMPADVQAKLEKLQNDLKAAQDAKDVKAQAIALTYMGALYYRTSNYEKALDTFNQVLPLYRQMNNIVGEALILKTLANLSYARSEKQAALDYFNQALALYRQLGDHKSEGEVLDSIGFALFSMGEKQKALDYYNQALPLRHQADDHDGEATTLKNIGVVYDDLDEKQKALDYYNQALTIWRQIGDPRGEAVALSNIGTVYSDLGERQQALESFNQALPFLREIGDLKDEAVALNNSGKVWSDLGEKQKALDDYNQALPLRRQAGDRDGEAITLNNLGKVYSDLGEDEKALDDYGQALSISRELGDHTNEAVTLNNIGRTYDNLGEQQKALNYYNQALPVLRDAGDRSREATALNNIANIYDNLGEKQKALDDFNQALDIFRQADDPSGQATTLVNIGKIYRDLGEKQKALDYYNRSLPIAQQIGDRAGEAKILNNISAVYFDLNDTQKELDYINRALRIATQVGDPLLEATLLHNLMQATRSSQAGLAIFYGKQAVNLLQQVRGNLRGLDKELQSSFLSSKDDYYHDLASLLIDQGRLPEAQQVLDLLKQQEYSDYVRGDTNLMGPLSLTPAEQQAEEDYQKSTAQLVSLGDQWSQLRKLPARTPEQEKQLQQLSDALSQANQGLNDYYARLYKLFGDSDANKQVADVKGQAMLLRQQIARMPHTVALYTMMTKERYSVLVISGSAPMVGRKYDIPQKELYQKVAAFERALRDPSQDPRPMAQALYDIVLGPVKADLDQAQAQTLVWSLDGVLRYIPIAALYDGKQYVIEKYNIVAFTPASIPYLSEEPDLSSVSAVAMGISQQYEDDLNPLPTVVSELDDIIHDPQVKDANGVLPGSILLNGQFTEKAMENQLAGQHAVVHVASHFVFRPGDDNQSYLLLAGKDTDRAGYHLTVADFRDNQNLSLTDTDLLTLSACETGISGNAGDGREVDGLATTAQLKGARAVISTMWSVNDSSTGQLMADFYKRWAEGGGKVMKVEALRQAQLDLLQGKLAPKPNPADPNAPTSFAHPFYWAPFVLTGNWK